MDSNIQNGLQVHDIYVTQFKANEKHKMQCNTNLQYGLSGLSTIIMESVCLHGDARKDQSITLSLSRTHNSIKGKRVLRRYPIIPTQQVKDHLATYIRSYKCVKITHKNINSLL